jgi:cupin superfamily acireductone dioxygenase involved in methionine salvage
MSTTTELVRAKNVDLLIHQYNSEVKKLNRDGFLNKDSKEFKDLRNKYENLIARFDTDKNTSKKEGEYNYNIALDSKQIIGIKGIKPTLNIRSK